MSRGGAGGGVAGGGVGGGGVEALYRSLLDAWNRCDADAFGALFADDGSLVGFDGSSIASRAAIVDHLSGIFADHQPAAYVAKMRGTRAVAAGVALLDAIVGMVRPGESDIHPGLNAIQCVVAVEGVGGEGGGGWRVAHFQTTPAALHGRPHEVEAMTVELREVLVARG